MVDSDDKIEGKLGELERLHAERIATLARRDAALPRKP
jgi:hypothetical protein